MFDRIKIISELKSFIPERECTIKSFPERECTIKSFPDGVHNNHRWGGGVSAKSDIWNHRSGMEGIYKFSHGDREWRVYINSRKVKNMMEWRVYINSRKVKNMITTNPRGQNITNPRVTRLWNIMANRREAQIIGDIS